MKQTRKKFLERGQLNLSQVNKDMCNQWQKENLFARSVIERDNAPSFVFYEGPPSANGMPGIHHVMARTIKDCFCRYKTMCGYQVKRKAGWDTHGLPVELGVEKALGITKDDIGKKISVQEYNNYCRSEVMKYKEKWSDLTIKMGYWVDLDNPYTTYDNSYIETLWWLLKQLYRKGLIYKGYTIQPYSPAAGTGLSSHELNQPGCYRDIKDTTVTAQFRVINPTPEMMGWGDIYILAWTTTPWTLPSNTALCIGRKIEYAVVRTYNQYTGKPVTVILAEERLPSYFNEQGSKIDLNSYTPGDKIIPYRIVSILKGTELEGMQYEQLFPWVKPIVKDDDGEIRASDKGFRVIHGDYVSTDDGTGIVHIAPTFGSDDAFVAKEAGVPALYMINRKLETKPMVDFSGKYWKIQDLDPDFVEKYVDTELYKEYQGLYVMNAYDPKFNIDGKYNEKKALSTEDLNLILCIKMRQSGLAFKIEKHIHSYPHCWRTDMPVLYYPLDSWFIKTSAVRDKMSQLNKSIKWKPESTGTGRFGKWLENLNDWNLSRSRYWGTPLPIWRNDEGEEICIESIEELYNEIEKSVKFGFMNSNPLKDKGFTPGDYSSKNYDKIDLHRPFVDDIILVSGSGKAMKRELDLIDVWFDSGAMPFAQLHYPFENSELIDNGSFYPANFIAEGVDQTRGWFYTLHAISAMVRNSVAFKAVVSNGLVLDKNGNKMSKRLGNAIDPFNSIEVFGSDSLRWYMITNSQPWDNLRFDEEGVKEVQRKFFGTLHNTYRFFAQYANLDGFVFDDYSVPKEKIPVIDCWIISELNSLVKNVAEYFDDYEPTRAGRLISDFVIDYLSNWYVHLSRERFWVSEMSQDKISAYQTLYTCLETVSRLMAPIAPFYADQLYRDLVNVTGRNNFGSVHLAKFPESDKNLIDKELEARMELAQKITSMVLALRKRDNVKLNVRKPLSKILIPADKELKNLLEPVKELIGNETNVKEVVFVESASNVLVKRAKCNFKILGKKHGPLMKGLAAEVDKMSQADVAALERLGSIDLNIQGSTVTLNADEVDIYSEDIPGWVVANEGTITVALDITITDGLKNEGIARELKKRLQDVRKAVGLEITDRIDIKLLSNPDTDFAVLEHSDWIKEQVLANSLEIVSELDDGDDISFDNYSLRALVKKDN
ncbi:MAG TPA: isoleucine--tRNA ligase [Bacteroidaceae bacterium]|nr:isoleucine--tRNA ligase [Bacteroidaceae bacterium]